MQLIDDFGKLGRRAGLFKMMSKEDRNILKEFSGRVRDRFSDARVWAFGSRARGEATWESDFDIFIVLNEVDQKMRPLDTRHCLGSRIQERAGYYNSFA